MIKRITLKKQAYDYLYQALLEGQIEESRIYSEQYFAELLGISRTPVREAVMQLSQEGFLQIHPNKGFSLRRMKPKELEDLYTYRTALEGYCACQAAKKRTTSRARALLNKLRQQYQAQKAAYDIGEPVERWVELDFAFHGALIDYLANEEFSASMERLRTRLVLLEKFSLVYCEGRMERVLEEHRSTIEAIASGQTDDVMDRLEGHFNRCRDVLITLQKEPKP